MIKEFQFYHGVVFAKLLHYSNSNINISVYPTEDNASYVINNKIGIYIKYSTKRLSPWRFSFIKRHQEEMKELKNKFDEVYLTLVCNDDGIVILSYKELKQILDDVHDDIEWICASRNKRKMYTVNGSNGKLRFKIGVNDFCKIFSSLS